MALTFERRILLLLFYILALHAIAILVFTRGFLLSRNELPLFSTCGDLQQDHAPCDFAEAGSVPRDSAKSSSLRKHHCWTPPAVKKIVILIFDALRFDFIAPSSFLEDRKKPWMDRLQVVQKLIAEESSQARLFKFIADPPTTSLQRLKGLTTGSLPTFIDVGNSFGAPAIVEDNLINQLKTSGKKVILMGDDTWVDLFPSHFFQAHAFPSFNVKDLHTVDNGVLENLFPALYDDSWDVLIGHFLGVDHVGHIFGVESLQMLEKLEQYNKVIEDVITILRNQSQDDGLHEETLLLVFGDHGQTVNGDHGGGTAEEVETGLFAWSSRQSTYTVSQQCDSSCMRNVAIQNPMVRESQPCICSFQQLDFAATFSAILGIPFPYGSIGKVNRQLLGLVAKTWQPSQQNASFMNEDKLQILEWLKIYSTILCINSWQVNRYFEQYAKSSMNGFSADDFTMLHMLYNSTQSFSRAWFMKELDMDAAMNLFSDGIGRYTKYLNTVASLARSKWTKFDDALMAFGVIIMLMGLLIQMKAVYMFVTLGSTSFPAKEEHINILPLHAMITTGFTFGLTSAGASAVICTLAHLFLGGSVSLSKSQFLMVFVGGTALGTVQSYLFRENFLQAPFHMANRMVKYCWGKWFDCPDLIGLLAIVFCCIHACSLLSNSYILREQQVASFLLVSIGVLDLRTSIQQDNKVLQALCFLILNFIMSSVIGDNYLKENDYHRGEVREGKPIFQDTPSKQSFFYSLLTAHVPLFIIGYAFLKKLCKLQLFLGRHSRVLFVGLPIAYVAISLHWLPDDLDTLQLVSIPGHVYMFARLFLPRTVYTIVAFQTLLLVTNIMNMRKTSDIELKNLFEEAPLGLLAVLSSIIILLIGRQGPIVAIIAGLEAWCLLDKQSLYAKSREVQCDKAARVNYLPAAVQWSLFAIQLFFCTGHRCAFDGLHYAAAFIGFDQFNIYRQGVLLALDTFGASHLLPVLGLPLLAARGTPSTETSLFNQFYIIHLSQVLLIFGLIRTLATTFTTLCVTIQRRHLMVWGLFAPKFVFDVLGLLVTDMAVLFVFLYVMWPLIVSFTHPPSTRESTHTELQAS